MASFCQRCGDSAPPGEHYCDACNVTAHRHGFAAQYQDRLLRHVATEMRMSAVWQPAMIVALLKGPEHGVLGYDVAAHIATYAPVATSLDVAKLARMVPRMVGAVLRKRGIVEYTGGRWRLRGPVDDTMAIAIRSVCEARIQTYLQTRDCYTAYYTNPSQETPR